MAQHPFRSVAAFAVAGSSIVAASTFSAAFGLTAAAVAAPRQTTTARAAAIAADPGSPQVPLPVATLAATALASQAGLPSLSRTIMPIDVNGVAAPSGVQVGQARRDIQTLADAVAAEVGAPASTAAVLANTWASTTPARRTAVLTALAQVGDPYRTRGKGPDAFDCSGLTGFAWAAAGVTIPPNSTLQIKAAADREPLQVQPGDLVWRPGHVMLSLGYGNLIVHAPYTGTNVRIEEWGKMQRVGDPLRGA